jgi:ribosomal protein S6
VEDAKAALKEILAKHKTTIVKEDGLGAAPLAYEIDGQTEGYSCI